MPGSVFLGGGAGGGVAGLFDDFVLMCRLYHNFNLGDEAGLSRLCGKYRSYLSPGVLYVLMRLL